MVLIEKKKILINSPVPIVDNETSNNLAELGWEFTKGIPHCIGILYKDEMIQITLTNPEKEKEFKEKALKLLKSLPQPFFALNRNMEHGNFLGYFDENFDVREIQPFKGKGWSKDAFFEVLKENKKITDDILNSLNSSVIDGKEIISAFENKQYDKIIEHNHNCLIKEFCIMKHKEWFLGKYAVNDRGWIED